ncbi:hypothetical protein [Streptomyces sp. HSG2]|uniref:hypothetical protein n=1 Tax=Streptomyces sp. HSG2 TaxID=2797167 RepID=UPI0019032DCA|nr:hypothetical protein [Streptomyces sp. HSG2]
MSRIRGQGPLGLRERLTRGDAVASTVAFALLATVEWLAWLDEPLVGAGVGSSVGH